MVQYPICPVCGNANSALSVVDVKFAGWELKGIQCNNPQCKHYLGFFQDSLSKIEEIQDLINDLESKVDDLESDIDNIK